MKIKTSIMFIITVFIIILTGCIYTARPQNLQTPIINTFTAQPTNTPVITIQPTETPSPTPTETETPTPTLTPVPTKTPEPTQSVSHSPVPDIKQVDAAYADSLDINGYSWYMDRSSRTLLEKYGGFCIKDTGDKRIYLTYNLGTEAGLTDKLLDMLKEKNVKASFFPTGDYVKNNTGIIRRIVREGHLLGSHGETHANQTKITLWPTDKLIQDFDNLQKRFRNIFGDDFRIHYYRPPYGIYSERTLYIARTLGYTPIFWSYTYNDYDYNKPPIGVDKTYKLYMDNLRDGAIYQLHVIFQDTVDVLDNFIDDARAMGYEFYRVDDQK